jgi:hypothetical protein
MTYPPAPPPASTPITTAEVERFRATDPRAVAWPRDGLVHRLDALSTPGRAVYGVCGRRVHLERRPDGFLAACTCDAGQRGRRCAHALAAVDEELVRLEAARAQGTYRSRKREQVVA